MAFNIAAFRSNMIGDGARPNLFECSITMPAGIAGAQANEQYTFMARAAQIPGSTVNSIPVMYFGRELKFAGNRTFPDWTVTIINDEGFVVRTAIEQWMNTLNMHLTNIRAPNYVDPFTYQADGFIRQFAKDGSGVLQEYKFVGMFPVDLSPIEMDWAQNDTIEEFTVTFAYQWWENVQSTT